MKYTLIIAIIVLFIACNPKQSSNAQLASLVCSCAKPLVAYNEQLKTLAAEEKMDLLLKKMSEGDQVMETAANCVYDKSINDLIELDLEKIDQKITEQCQLDKRMIDDLLNKVDKLESSKF